RQDDDLAAPAAGVLDVAAVDAQHQLRPGINSGADLLWVETVNRDAVALGAEGADGLADAVPGRARVAAQVGDVGASVAVVASQGENLVQRQSRRVVDFSVNGDVVRPVARWWSALLAEELGQVAEVLRTALGGAADPA